MAAEMAQSEWAALKAVPEKSLPLPNLERLTSKVWSEINALCDLNQVTLNVNYDPSLFLQANYLNTLAVASRTMWLVNDVWTPTAMLPRQLNHLSGNIDIKVNPYVPNGWFEDDGRCNIGNHFDLKTVLRHEILHGIGVASSFQINATSQEQVGYLSGGVCYPFVFDTKVKTVSGAQVIDGCDILPGKSIKNNLYVNNIRIYNPSVYSPGSSYHHVDLPGTLMYYGIPSKQCLYIDRGTIELLNGLGVECQGTTIGIPSAANEIKNYYSLFILIIMSIKCLMGLLRS